MALAQEIVVLQPLGQVGEPDHLPGLELVPHVHGELLRLLRRIGQLGSRVQPTRIQPTNLLGQLFLLDGYQVRFKLAAF